MLKVTDNTDPSGAVLVHDAGGLSRIAMVDTQGDNSGGAIIAWVIIGGADGFVINPDWVYFSDGSFVDHGVIQPPSPTLPPGGTRDEFSSPGSTAYTHLSADPNASMGNGGYVYVPGPLIAIWR